MLCEACISYTYNSRRYMSLHLRTCALQLRHAITQVYKYTHVHKGTYVQPYCIQIWFWFGFDSSQSLHCTLCSQSGQVSAGFGAIFTNHATVRRVPHDQGSILKPPMVPKIRRR
ncbi:hypothetical protein CEXT_393731 [Caerostris extrusa]|uniref:Uncharacterized protein n=1 Tax=Caerostris extrusa TaxID=172846 RepID=A0AAV4T631_CAEEX|nr:hypothetical protein CEXT_393731 [Caerostris extrusa]